MNGMGRSITQIEKIVNRLDHKVDLHGERLAAVETETENLKEKERVTNVRKRRS